MSGLKLKASPLAGLWSHYLERVPALRGNVICEEALGEEGKPEEFCGITAAVNALGVPSLSLLSSTDSGSGLLHMIEELVTQALRWF